MNASYWEKEVFFKHADFAIIGSGIVGLNAALSIKANAPHARVLVLERGTLPSGASTKNAGFACFGSLTELLDDLEQQSEDEVLALVEKRWQGLLRLRQTLGDNQLEYQNWGGYELFTHEEQEIYEKCADQMSSWNKKLAPIIGHKSVFQIATDQLRRMPFKGIQSLIWNATEGQIHTGKMMHSLWQLAIKKGIDIYNGIDIVHFEDHGNRVTLKTNSGTEITTSKVIICTNGFAQQLLPQMPLQPTRNQVLITEPIDNLSFKGTFHYDRGYVYFRNINKRILLGGFRHLDKAAETTDEFGQTPLIQKALIDFLKNTILPHQEVKIEHWWSGIMGVGTSKAPIVQQYSPNVSIGIRLGGMGVAIGSLIGEEVAQISLSS